MMLHLRRCSPAARILLACSTLAVLALPPSAKAAQIQVTYTVTDGMFGGVSLSDIEIKSGTLTYLVPTAGTNAATFVANAPPILQSLRLVGATPDQVFSLKAPLAGHNLVTQSGAPLFKASRASGVARIKATFYSAM